MIRNAWYVVGLAADFAYELQGKKVASLPIVMWRDKPSGEVVAYEGRCSHKRFPLWEGVLREDGSLQCAYHGWCYDAKGECVAIPAQVSGKIPSRANLRRYPVVEQDGLVWLWAGQAEQADMVCAPRVTENMSDEWQAVVSPRIDVMANLRLLTENLLDITHFFPLHDGNIGDVENSYIPVGVVEEEVDGSTAVMTIRHVEGYRLPPFYQDWFGLELVDREHTHRMVSPGLTRVELRVAPPGMLSTDKETGYVLYHTGTPVDERNLQWRWILCCKSDHRYAADPSKGLAEAIAETFPQVVAQDEWALKKQQEMMEFSEEGYAEVNIKTDVGVVRARRVLARLESEEKDPSGAESFVPGTAGVSLDIEEDS